MSEQAKFTPGPWMVLPSVQDGQFCILTEHGPRKDIACTYGFPADPREANARLIAAAPELLEALQRLMRHFPPDSDLEVAGWLPREIEAACDAYDAARAAVARALGQ